MNQADWDDLMEQLPGTLDDEERIVLQLRLGADRNGKPRPVEDVATILNVDQRTVNGLEAVALRKLKAVNRKLEGENRDLREENQNLRERDRWLRFQRDEGLRGNPRRGGTKTSGKRSGTSGTGTTGGST